MKKKMNFGFLALLMLCLFSACSNDDNNEKSIEVPEKQQLDQKVYADETQGESGVTFTTIAAWASSITETTTKSLKSSYKSVNPDWVSITPDKGDKGGTYTIILTLMPNYTGIERSATITIDCNGDKIEIKVKQEAVTQDGVKPSPKEVDVYISGYEHTGSKNVAVYWKNGEKISLNSKYDAYAESVFVVGNDVYVAGREYNGSEYHNMKVYDAKYWKNGKEVVLGNGINPSYAQSIYVHGNNVYVVGYEEQAIQNEDGNWSLKNVVKCWKNGIEMALDGNNSGYAESVFVTSNGDVYVLLDNHSEEITYWKNGISTTWNFDFTVSPNDIFVSGNDVYVAGYKYVNSNDIAVYWKNGKEVVLGTPNVCCSNASSIFVEGNDVHVVGDNSDGKPVHWKNGKPTVLPSSGFSGARSMYILNGNVYICGYEELDMDVDKVLYWKNGKLEDLGYGYATAIFAVERQ